MTGTPPPPHAPDRPDAALLTDLLTDLDRLATNLASTSYATASQAALGHLIARNPTAAQRALDGLPDRLLPQHLDAAAALTNHLARQARRRGLTLPPSTLRYLRATGADTTHTARPA
ncbi:MULTISPECIES: hypothetical protein [Actinomadura]|uniref:Uncharacterized protein n=1 Tax=Actinomadura yumaensis TaxID=111807 RepID=A0ABW2CWD6_9ACTN|nr:hypothetical protein [Actinomadura sp. J1-007]MWK39592.1 hypothetical protein [Actinomadura sp. J1-007]